MTGKTFDLGFLPRGEVVSNVTTMKADGTTKIDVHKFTTGSIGENVAIGTAAGTSDPFSLALFRDVNGNGILDNGDNPRLALSDTDPVNGPTNDQESVNVFLTQGTYFAQTKAFATSDITYLLSASRSKTGTANPLTSPEIPLGTITQDLRKTDRVSNNDTADNFAFTLEGNSVLGINVRELGNQKGDVNIRVVQDLNGNGAVDPNEVVVKGVSTNKGNTDTITGLNGAGDYILQVCQSKGNTNFEVKFDHAA